MSNLDCPISILLVEAKEISASLLLTGENKIQLTKKLNGIDRAINILRNEKMKDKIEEREKKEEPIPYTKKL